MGFEAARDQSGKRDADLRQKYLEAIGQLEAGEARWAQLELALRRIIGRLCLAARGRADPLDAELHKVSDLARGRGDISAIEGSLEPLSRAIAALDHASETVNDATSITRATPPGGYPSGGDTSAQARAPGSAVGVGTEQIARAPASNGGTTAADARAPGTTAPDVGTGPGAGAVSSDADAPGAPASSITAPTPTDRDTATQAVIVAVLDRLARLAELRPVLKDLQDRSKDSLSPDEFAEGLEKVARLVGEQRVSLMREKREIEELLHQMDARLAEIASYLANETVDQKNAQASTQHLDLVMMDEVRSIGMDVQSAGDLGSLRERVRDRLNTISSHLQEFRTREGARVSAQLDRTQRMRVRVSDLEREIHGLHKSLQEEQSLRMIDALTGIPNRAAYDDRIRQEFMRWQRENIPVSVLAWDIDRFKEINDVYGHSAGDKVLRVIAQHLAQHVRGTDFVARYGGEEFVMVLMGTDATAATSTADKIRVGIESMGFHFHNKPVAVTASCGITTFRGDDTPESIFDRADRALYRAKDSGRNCCRVL